jgi:hypothetical protein
MKKSFKNNAVEDNTACRRQCPTVFLNVYKGFPTNLVGIRREEVIWEFVFYFVGDFFLICLLLL